MLLALTDYPVLVQDAVGGARDAALFFAALVVGFGVLGIVAGALVSVGVDRVRPLWGAVGGVLAGVGMAVELLLGEAMPQPMGSIFLGWAAGVGLGLLGVAWATLFARRVAASSRLLLTCAMVAASLVLEGLCAFLGTIGARYFGLVLLGCLAVATAGVLLAGRLAVSPEGGDLRRGEKAGLRGTLVPAGRSLSLWMFVGGLALPLAIRGFKWGEVLIGYPASAAFFGFERPLIGMLVAGAATVLVVRGTEAQLHVGQLAEHRGGASSLGSRARHGHCDCGRRLAEHAAAYHANLGYHLGYQGGPVSRGRAGRRRRRACRAHRDQRLP